MKIPWKGLAILAVLVFAIVYDLPTVLTYLPEDDSVEKEKIEGHLRRIEGIYGSLKQMQLALVESKKNRIQLLADDGFVYPNDNAVLDTILNDNFTVEENEQGIYLNLKKDAGEDVFVTDVGNSLNGLLTNVRKIKLIRLSDNGRSIVFELEKDKRLTALAEPLKTFLGDDFELYYKAEKNQYVTRWKLKDNVVNLGLDLQGGMYLDIGVETDMVVHSIQERLAEELEDVMIDDNVNYDTVEQVSDTEVEIILEPDENFELTGEKYERLLGRSYSVVSTENGHLITLSEDDVERIRKNAIEQALETIRNRIDQLGVKEPTIQLREEDSIIIRLPGATDFDQARRLIGNTAILQFMLKATEGSLENPGDDQVVLFEEIRDELTKEVIRTIPHLLEKKVLLQGDRIRDSRVTFSQMGMAAVSISFDGKGKDQFAEISRNNVGRNLAIVLDRKVQSAPRITEEIASGEAQITGVGSSEEAAELALVLRSGSLPAPIIFNEERRVGPSLGADSVRKSLIALCLGLAAVMLFMMLYYTIAGVFAVMALIFNLLLIMALLAYFQATLTLPGMAGIILTIGMAVDANVLIFERIREEIRRGSPVRTAVNTGFKKATVTILDANITTVLAAIVLYQFGTGPVRGFAITLIYGIVFSMFTSIVVGRTLFEIVYLRRQKLEKISI